MFFVNYIFEVFLLAHIIIIIIKKKDLTNRCCMFEIYVIKTGFISFMFRC